VSRCYHLLYAFSKFSGWHCKYDFISESSILEPPPLHFWTLPE
jgi:hypothetical protein